MANRSSVLEPRGQCGGPLSSEPVAGKFWGWLSMRTLSAAVGCSPPHPMPHTRPVKCPHAPHPALAL